MGEVRSLSMPKDQMLVLYDLVARINANVELEFEDQAEQRVLWDLESELERNLEEVLSPSYREKVAEARHRVRDEGD